MSANSHRLLGSLPPRLSSSNSINFMFPISTATWSGDPNFPPIPTSAAAPPRVITHHQAQLLLPSQSTARPPRLCYLRKQHKVLTHNTLLPKKISLATLPINIEALTPHEVYVFLLLFVSL